MLFHSQLFYQTHCKLFLLFLFLIPGVVVQNTEGVAETTGVDGAGGGLVVVLLEVALGQVVCVDDGGVVGLAVRGCAVILADPCGCV